MRKWEKWRKKRWEGQEKRGKCSESKTATENKRSQTGGRVRKRQMRREMNNREE